ncbi:hypothetical protein HPB47_013326 [Ixodes persulcatus]|uniref:Uncharacterized protein n=1 Tax=Ixodes persulcatus TaxID=34615 RepID=A0AC60QYY7_IXOPE|nr:hypothetical protein HPB47_013326 [Ixodes persulcatus]
MATPSNMDATPVATANLQSTKVLTFNIVAPDQASSVDVMDAVAGVVGLPLVYIVHYLEGNVFQGIVRTPTAMTQLQARGDLSICGQNTALGSLAL